MYLDAPGGTAIVIIMIIADKPYEVKIDIKLKWRIFEKTLISNMNLKIDIADIRKKETNKKKCKHIPIVSHDAMFGKYFPDEDAKAI